MASRTSTRFGTGLSTRFGTGRVRRRRSTALVPLVGVGLAVALTGCSGGEGSGAPAADHGATHVMPDGTRMSDAQMQGMGGMGDMGGMASTGTAPAAGATDAGATDAGDAEGGPSPEDRPAPGRVTRFASGPSAAAAMICSKETADAVRRTFALPTDAPAEDRWRPPTYTCDYTLPHGALRLSVRDLRAGPAATAWFHRVQRHAAGAHRITGLQSLGLPAFEARGGRVGFLKDGRILLVDASAVPDPDLPPGFSRTGVAYGVAAAVIACWSE